MTKKTVLITGGTGNLGIHLARDFLSEGWNVIITSRHLDHAKMAANNIFSQIGLKPLSIEVNLSSEASINEMMLTLKEKGLTLDALVNNAAVDNTEIISSLSYESLSDILKVNFLGSAWLSRIVAEQWKNEKVEGAIVNISSLLSKYGAEGSSAYSASKAAIEAFSRCLAVEYGQFGIRINTVRIAGMSGDLTQQYAESRVIDFSDHLINKKNDFSKIPLKRGGLFSEYTRLVIFLTSIQSLYVTGQDFNIDGGASTVYPAYSLPKVST
jgi:3-oxoacyl-[acyl-carrier protein] reductase